MSVSRVIQWVCGVGLAAAGLAVFFRNVDTHGLAQQLAHTSPLVIVACAVLTLCSLWFRSQRWHIMLPQSGTGHKRQLFSIVTIAFMVNNILPARMGEAARAVLLWKRNGYAAAVSIGSIILERVIDLLAFMACYFVPVFLLPFLRPGGLGASANKTATMQTFAFLMAAVFLFVLGLFIAYLRFPAAMRWMGEKSLGLIPRKAHPRLRRIAAEIMSTLDWTFSAAKVAQVLALSFLIVSCYAVMIVMLTADRNFGFFYGLFSQSFAAFGAAIPLAPGFVGTLHAVMLEGLVLCGLGRDKAQAVTIIFHAVPYVTTTVLGLYYFFRMNIRFRDISEAEKTIEKEEHQ